MENNNITEEFVDGFYNQNKKDIENMMDDYQFNINNMSESKASQKIQEHFKDVNKNVENIIDNQSNNDDKVIVNTIIKNTSQQNLISNNFVILFTENMNSFIKKYRLTINEYQVIFCILELIEHGNKLVNVTQQYISDMVNISQPNVCRTFKSLIKKGLIIEDEYKNRFINSSLFIKGNINKMSQELIDNLHKSQNTMGCLKPTIKEKKDIL